MLLKSDLDIAVQGILATASGRSIGLATSMPYAILYPQGGPPGEGTWNSPEEDRWWNYQITSLGRDARQVTWMAERVRDIMISRGPGGYKYPIPVTGGFVQDRASLRLGAILPGGEDLWQIQDVYRVKAGM